MKGSSTSGYAIHIGDTVLPNGLMLAPMAGVTDGPFRSVCARCGADYTVTEMISAKALWYHDKKTALLARITEAHMPCAVQIFGSEPEIMAYAAQVLSSPETPCEKMPAAIDINMGCPMPKIVNNGEGAALMRQPPLAGRIIEAVRKATSLPVTVKIRAGWDCDHKNCVEIAQIAASLGVACVTVHGRTRSQMYAPGVDLSCIRAVRERIDVRIPVIGNGDIFCAEDAQRMRRETGCDGVMIARGAYGNPWIFSEIRAAMMGVPFAVPSTEERIETALAQIRELVLLRGEFAGIREGRKHLAWYTKGLAGAASLRARIMAARSLDEVTALLYTLAEKNGALKIHEEETEV
ncbi:MAG: tRNA dihydrouridine synthase DusB [Clostridia bacterium]|nr:tRNA dihydrouridine synthase DusB [Clostridia bacterium]